MNNTYKGFYINKTAFVTANTSYEAKKQAARVLTARKDYEVAVILVEKDGNPVVHSASII